MAVIRRTECRGLSIRVFMIQGIFWLLLLVEAGVRANPPNVCEQARKDAASAGLPADWLQNAPTGEETCGNNSCCSKKSEADMFVESKRHLDGFLRDSILKISSVIDVRAKKFDGLFREMMNTSKIQFHDMFQKTYGKIYLQNADVFADFFKELELYYKKGLTRLSDILDSFFVILYQRMFTVIHAEYHFDEKYLDCVSEHMKDVKPFEDIPQKFTVQLKRSFVATRTYYKALLAAAESARKLVNVGFDKDCHRELVQMQYCGSCNGLRGMGICSKYCAAVLEACLRHHTAFNTEWDNFIEALDKIADRLIGPYSIDNVVDPLDIKISDAIMVFQERREDVSQKIYTFCGKPTMPRRKRTADTGGDDSAFEIKYTPMKKINGGKKKKTKIYEEEEGPSLERLIKEIKTKLRETSQFWRQLPYQFCNNLSAPPSADGKCWNGTSIGEYLSTSKPHPGDSAVVKDQIYVLQMFTDKLRKAYHGEEVEFIDDTEEAVDGSGSGSGDFEIDPSENEETNRMVPKEDGDDFETVNEIPKAQPPPSTVKPRGKETSSGAVSTMSLTRALAQYLLPIVLVWFGGAISDLL